MEKILKKSPLNFFWVLILLVVAPIIVMNGCAGRTYTYNSVYFLTDQNLAARKAEANKGNAQAAFDVYLHYKFGMLNREPLQTKYWLERAAALGNVTAAEHLKANGSP